MKIIILLASILATTAAAQDVATLLTEAQRDFIRGDRASAKEKFALIQKVEPRNKIANTYLTMIAAARHCSLMWPSVITFFHLSISPGSTITNTAHLAWTSLPGTDAGERTGADGPGINGGIVKKQNPTHPCMNYVDVGSIDQAIEKAETLGAKLALPKIPIPGIGAIACLIDPEGNIVWDASRPDGTPRKLMDSSRLFALGWKPEVKLEEGIRLAYSDFLKRFPAATPH